ncbi:uncharacterized protein METZ01_LOCUS103629, partial [marine metagenome]
HCRIVFSGTYESARRLSIFYDAVSLPKAPLGRSTYGSEIIRASDPGEAAAIKAYLLRKYGIKATE